MGNYIHLTDPIARADQYLASTNPWEEKTLRVRIWGGSGSGDLGQHAFDTGNFSGAPKPPISLVTPLDKKPPIDAESPHSYTLFPKRNGAQWELNRYSFRNLDKSVGPRMIHPSPSAQAGWDAYMSWHSFSRYTAGPIVFYFYEPGDSTGPKEIRDQAGNYLYTAVHGAPGYINASLTRVEAFGLDLGNAIVPDWGEEMNVS